VILVRRDAGVSAVPRGQRDALVEPEQPRSSRGRLLLDDDRDVGDECAQVGWQRVQRSLDGVSELRMLHGATVRTGTGAARSRESTEARRQEIPGLKPSCCSCTIRIGVQRSSKTQRPAVARSRLWWVPKPVLITVLGAVVSALLVPAFTRQYQDRQREREIKVTLVGAIGDSTSDALVTSQFIAASTFPKGGQSEFNRLALEWARRSAEIDAKLAAYFPRNRVVDSWRGYAKIVENTFYLVTRDEGPRKQEALRNVRAYVGPAASVDWDLFSPAMHYGDPNALESYLTLSQRVLDRKIVLIQEILDAHAQGFSTTTGHLLRDLVPFA
jgi:hypothetical protein